MSPVILLLALNTNSIGKAYMSVCVSLEYLTVLSAERHGVLQVIPCCLLHASIAQDPRIFFEALPCLSRWRRVRRYIQQYNKVNCFSRKNPIIRFSKQSNPCFQPNNFLFSLGIPTFFPPLLFHQTPKPPPANTFVPPFFTPPPPPPPRFSPSTPSLPAMPDTDSFSDSRKR